MDEMFAVDHSSTKGKLNSDIYIIIKDFEGSHLQTVQIHTLCSVPIVLGDSFSGIILAGIMDKDGCSAGESLGCSATGSFGDRCQDSAKGTDACAGDCDKPAVLYMKYTGEDVIKNGQGPEKSSVAELVNGTSSVQIVASSKEDGSGDVYFQGEVAIGNVFAVDGRIQGKLNSNTYIIIKDISGKHLQTVQIHASCSVPIILGDRFGGVDLIGYKDKNNCGAGE